MSADPKDSRQSESDDQQAAYRAATAELGDMPAIDFNIFVLSLCTQTLSQLGESPDGTEHGDVDLAMARQTIDLLALLEDKTKGNLTGEEERLLQQVLLDLRMRYVAKARAT